MRPFDTLSPSMAAPGVVSQVKMENMDANGLWKISWTPPDGHWDHYRVLLFNGNETLVNESVGKSETEFSFSRVNLQPGREYKAAVSVESGGQTSTVYCQGTGIFFFCCSIATYKCFLLKNFMFKEGITHLFNRNYRIHLVLDLLFLCIN